MIITYYLHLLEPLNCLLFMCSMLIPWKNLGLCNYSSKAGLVCCLWTFVGKMEDWRRITSNCLNSLTHQVRCAHPARKTCSPNEKDFWPSEKSPFGQTLKVSRLEEKLSFGKGNTTGTQDRGWGTF